MSKLTGWYVAIGSVLGMALWNSRRPGEMTAERDSLYRKCLSGLMPVSEMRELARAFEKARCYPQSAMILKRIALEELPDDVKAERRRMYQKAKGSRNKIGVLQMAAAFESAGATSSAARLRRHAARLPDPTVAQPVVTPPPQPTVDPQNTSPVDRSDDPMIIDTSSEEISAVSDVRHSNGMSHAQPTETLDSVAAPVN